MTNVLPKAGGTGDQDPEFMRDFRHILTLEHEHREKEEKLSKINKEIKKQIKGCR